MKACLARPLCQQNGMALLIVISIISLLVVLTLQFNKTMRHHLLVSGYHRDGMQLQVMAESGVAIASAILQSDTQDNDFDTVFDSWANLADEDFSPLFEFGELELAVEDLSGRFPINSLLIDWKKLKKKEDRDAAQKKEHTLRNVFWRLLRAEPFSLEDGKAREIIDCTIDWLDRNDGDGEQEYGAESSYYQSQDPPYLAGNGPVSFVEELLLIKGFSPELLYGDEEHQGLASLITVQVTDGTININTANPILIRAFHEEMTKELVETIGDFREDEENKELLSNKLWYTTIPSFPGYIQIEKDIISTQSSHFEIITRVQQNDVKKSIKATVKRDNGKVLILRWSKGEIDE